MDLLHSIIATMILDNLIMDFAAQRVRVVGPMTPESAVRGLRLSRSIQAKVILGMTLIIHHVNLSNSAFRFARKGLLKHHWLAESVTGRALTDLFMIAVEHDIVMLAKVSVVSVNYQLTRRLNQTVHFTIDNDCLTFLGLIRLKDLNLIFALCLVSNRRRLISRTE